MYAKKVGPRAAGVCRAGARRMRKQHDAQSLLRIITNRQKAGTKLEACMKKMRNTLLITVIAVAIAVPAWSAPGAEKSSVELDFTLSAAGEFPIVDKKVDIDVLAVSRHPEWDYDNRGFVKWYEELTNVHVNWMIVPFDGAQQKVNLVLASGDLPDAFSDVGFSRSEMVLYGAQGTFIPLNDMIEKWGINMKKIFAENPIVKQRITMPDGNIYDLIEIDECYHCSMNQKMWIYTPWLDKLNLKMPETTDDFYNVLKAFKTRDPNGNGAADEIPYTTSTQAWAGNVDGFLMMPFIYHDYTNHMYVDNGKVKMAFAQPEWREGLRYIRKLYAEELIGPESWTQTGDQRRRLLYNKDVIVGTSTDGYLIGSFVGDRDTTPEGKRYYEYKTVPALRGPNGVRWSFYSYDFVTVPGSFSITNQAEYPEVIFRWAEALLDEDMTLNKYYGMQGQAWDKVPPGSVGMSGEPATWKLLIDSAELNLGIAHTLPHNWSARVYNTQLIGLIPTEKILYEETKKNYEPYRPPAEMILPDLFFDEAQSSELVSLKVAIENYYKEMTARFITGDADIEKDWDSYVREFDRMNLARYLEIYQAAYDEQIK